MAKRLRRNEVEGAANGAGAHKSEAGVANGSARGSERGEPSRPALCCGCHDTFQGHASCNLPNGRFLCEECHSSVTCYVCNTKRPHPEEGELQRCDNCSWRAAHYGCLGFRHNAPKPWYCFRCEDPAGRPEQALAIPVLDVRVHEDYVVQARRAGSAKKRALQRARDDESVSVAAGPTGGVVKRLVPARSLVRAVELRARGLAEAAAAGQTLVDCPHCANANMRHRNYCVCCGLALHGVSLDYNDHVVRGTQQPYQASKPLSPMPRFDDGSFLLATVSTATGKRLLLVCSADRSELRWVEPQ
jgi:hypothetical protein